MAGNVGFCIESIKEKDSSKGSKRWIFNVKEIKNLYFKLFLNYFGVQFEDIIPDLTFDNDKIKFGHLFGILNKLDLSS